jgi:hypothetical protein
LFPSPACRVGAHFVFKAQESWQSGLPSGNFSSTGMIVTGMIISGMIVNQPPSV